MDMARQRDRSGVSGRPFAPSSTRPGRRRALLAEGAPLSRQFVKALLEQGAFRVRLAAEGAEAVAAVAGGEAFDVVLMDLDMPVMDGFAATAAIRGLGSGRGAVPVVALVAAGQAADVVRAHAAGMSGTLTRPFDPETFVRDVEGLIAGAAVPPGRPTLPVWDRRVFEDLAGRLGAARIEPCLGLFESHLRRARAGLSRPDVPAAEVAYEAHALVSSAGMLGFADLCAVSDEAQRPATGPDAASAMAGALGADLLGAIDRALACLSQARARPADA